MRPLLSLTLLLFLWNSSPVALRAQSDKPRAALAPVAVLGSIDEAQKTLLYNSLRGELSTNFDLVSANEYSAAEEQAFNELEADECTTENCVRLVQEFLQLESLFVLQLTEADRLFQASLTEYGLDSSRTVTNECIDCSASELLTRVRQISRNFLYSSQEQEQLSELNQLFSNPNGPTPEAITAFRQFDEDHSLATLEQATDFSALTQRNLGILYREGRGVSANDTKAVFWLEKAAAQGDVLAMHRLGFLHFYGKGTPQNYEAAFNLYRQAAESGYGPAQFNLASMYRKGQGTKANEEEAINWYRKAANNGMRSQSQKVLAWMGAN